jgi:hypothetical protein
VKAAPHRHEYGFSLVSRKSISYLEFVKSGSLCGVPTSPEMAGQMLCTLEASGAMATSMIESVHVFALMCFMLAVEVVGGVVGVGVGTLSRGSQLWIAPTPTPKDQHSKDTNGQRCRFWLASQQMRRHASIYRICRIC